MPKPYSFDVVMKDVENLRTEPGVAAHAALLPHESFASLFKAASDLFEHLMTGGASNLETWWRDARKSDRNWYHNNPVVQSCPDDTKRIPLGIHGDDAGMAGLESVLCITWGSVASGQCNTLDTRIASTMLK